LNNKQELGFIMNEQELKNEIKIIQKELFHNYPILENENIYKELTSEISEWKRFISKKLQLDNPFETNIVSLNIANKELEENINSVELINKNYRSYLDLRNISKLNIEENFWNEEIKKLEKSVQQQEKTTNSKIKIVNKKNEAEFLNKEILLTRKLLLQRWGKSLDEEYLKWELNELAKYRKELLKKLSGWLNLLNELNTLLSSLSIEPGLLFDLSKGIISLQNIDELKKWLQYISKTRGVKELCDLLGKIRNTEKTIKQEKVKSISHIKETIIDINSNEEIIGIKLGKDIEHAIPEELALLSDIDTSILFDLKYIEGRLLCFDMQGIQENILKVEEDKIVNISEEDKLGPIIICVDTSGSMSGSPEMIAKAVTLYLATRAKKQKRDCYLINFSVSIETLDLTGNIGLDKLLTFLRKSFYGGTDILPALNHSIEILKKDNYKKADVLVISDFVMGEYQENLINKIKKIKENNNHFYSLVIGNDFLNKNNKEIFTNEWIYNPNNNNLVSLKNIVDEITF
jgi:uncharacterized protein with von Willebrand factor type A (vWA) domain